MINSLVCKPQADPFPALPGSHGERRSYTTPSDTIQATDQAHANTLAPWIMGGITEAEIRLAKRRKLLRPTEPSLIELIAFLARLPSRLADPYKSYQHFGTDFGVHEPIILSSNSAP